MGTYMIGTNEYVSGRPEAGLYIVSTPIGNLGDITLRALEILSSADIIACEDTRTSAKLLNRYAINARRVAYHEHNAEAAGARLLAEIQKGKVVALVSDAGTPLVSDPGQRLVTEAGNRGLPVFPVPGASAPIAALTASGMPTDRFTFSGFLPSKRGQRINELKRCRDTGGSHVFFESPARLADCLSDMAGIFGDDQPACVCRELTKLHEEVRRGSLADLAAHYHANPARGEIVIVLGPQAEQVKLDTDALLTELLETHSVSRAAGEAAKLTGLSKRDLYQRALAISDRRST